MRSRIIESFRRWGKSKLSNFVNTGRGTIMYNANPSRWEQYVDNSIRPSVFDSNTYYAILDENIALNAEFMNGDRIDMTSRPEPQSLTATAVRERMRDANTASRDYSTSREPWEEFVRRMEPMQWQTATPEPRPYRPNPFSAAPERPSSQLFAVFQTIFLREGSYEQFTRAFTTEERAHAYRMKLCKDQAPDIADTYFVRGIGELDGTN